MGPVPLDSIGETHGELLAHRRQAAGEARSRVRPTRALANFSRGNPGLSSAIPWPSSSESVSEAEAAGRSDLLDRCANAGLCHGPTCAGTFESKPS